MTNSQFQTLVAYNTQVLGDIAAIRGDIKDLRTELKGDIAELRTEIADVRTELRESITSVRADMEKMHQSLKKDIAHMGMTVLNTAGEPFEKLETDFYATKSNHENRLLRLEKRAA